MRGDEPHTPSGTVVIIVPALFIVPSAPCKNSSGPPAELGLFVISATGPGAIMTWPGGMLVAPARWGSMCLRRTLAQKIQAHKIYLYG
eukprot:SAG25_NODE_2867_length_1342_cov_59.870475_1_plen_87_part_10